MTRKTKDLNLGETSANSKNNSENKEIKKTNKSTSTTKRKSTLPKKESLSTKSDVVKSTSTRASRQKKSEGVSVSKNSSNTKRTSSNVRTSRASTSKTKSSNTKSTKSTRASSKKTPLRTVKRAVSTKVSKTPIKKPVAVEYYDLPYGYNQTVVKVLAQTPNTLFIYWEISDYDRENYKKNYGENFFEVTKPVLKIYNDTLNYSFEVDINDFANSWYLHVNDSKCQYRVELGRRPLYTNSHTVSQSLKETPYIYISSSNKIDAPNDKILFNPSQRMVYFKNVKTNEKTLKDITSFSFMQNIGKFNNIYELPELYQKLYHEIYKEDSYNELEINNPSSGGFSSKFK